MVGIAAPSTRKSTRQKRTSGRVPLGHTSDHSTSDNEEEDFSSDSALRTPAKRSKATIKRGNKRAKKSKQPVEELASEADEDPNRVENFLYEAIMDPEASIDTLVSDFLDSYTEDAMDALKDLVNLVLRCCGTKQEITQFDVEDADTIPETLTQLQDHLTGKDHDVVRTSADTYPWISRNKTFKVLRRQLPEFWRNLVIHSANKQILYEEEAGTLWATIESWLVSMSSSALRAFRHTSTAICLTIVTSLVEISVKLVSDLDVANRQLASEQKRSKKATAKIKTIQKTIAEKSEQNEKLTEMISNYFDAVFVHRYRDVDARIRTDNIKELGVWMIKLPTIFLEGQYLRYLGWVLSDTNGTTRLEAIKALTRLYANEDYAGGLRHFTERFKQRIMEIVTEDSETSIRCAALALVDKIRERGYLEEEDTEQILGCVFDSDARVRAAATETFHRVLADRESVIIDEQLNGNVEDHGDLKTAWVPLKALVASLTTVNKTLQKAKEPEHQVVDFSREQDVLCSGRTRIAAETFLQGLDGITFDSVSDYLLYDNDASVEPATNDPEDLLKSVLCLSDNEESLLLEILVATAYRAADSRETKKSTTEDEDLVISVEIMNQLPKLMAKFKDASKLTTILQLVDVCKLTVYTKYRKTGLLDDLLSTLVELFFGYQEESLLRAVGSAMLLLAQEDTLQAIVRDTLVDLHDKVRTDFLALKLTEPELILALKRLEIVSSIDDCILSFDRENPGGDSIFSKLTSQINSSIASVVMHTRICLRNYFMWSLREIVENRADVDVTEIEGLVEKRDSVLSILDDQVQQHNLEAAMFAAELEAMFTCLSKIENFDSREIGRPLDANLQTLIFAVLQKAMKRYSKLHGRPLHFDGTVSSDDDEAEEESDHEDGGDIRAQEVASERKICAVAGEIVAAIAAQKMDSKYIALLLANKGRLGSSYDAILKEIPAELMASSKAVTGKRKARAAP